MIVCDICKTKKADWDVTVTVDDNGTTKELELCGICHKEFRCRENHAKHQAYEDTIKAMGGEIKRKSHWWDIFTW